MLKRSLKELNLLDDFLFGKMLTHPTYGEQFCRLLLRILLNKEFQNLVVVPQKTYNGADTSLHGARLDVYLEGTPIPGTNESVTIYDMEPEQNDRSAAISVLPKRVRFYHAIIDTHSLESGEKYTSLKNVVVIMILPFDPFGYGHMIYTVQNQILELPEAPYDDGSRTMFFYTKGKKGDIPESICQLLHYMEDTRPDNAVNEDLLTMHQMVDAIKNNKELSLEYMKIFEREQMIFENGLEQNKLNLIKNCINLKYPVEEIAKILSITAPEVLDYITELKEMETA